VLKYTYSFGLFAVLYVSASPLWAIDSALCKQMLSLSDTDVSILTADVVPATNKLPEHCRVYGYILPAVSFEVRLPENWNGKFLMVGNGGYAGSINVNDQQYGLSRGYATASTDTGHQGPSPSFGLNNRAAEIDFAFRSIHVSTEAAKDIVAAYFGNAPQYSYYRGCSTGGRQGLMEAQRFPDDFDGLSIGAPLYDFTDKQTYNASWVAKAVFGSGGQGYISPGQLKTLNDSVYARCDSIDGLEDGLIDDPRQCDFEPRRDLQLCTVDRKPESCFLPAQIESITKIYDGPGTDIYPGAIKGGEIDVGAGIFGSGGWDTYFMGTMDPDGQIRSEPIQLRNGTGFFKFLAFEHDRPDFDVFIDLDFQNIPDMSFMAGMMNATDTDLSRVRGAGKRIIMWHGWADVGLNPLRTIDYYEGVRQAIGTDETNEFMRLFLVPGMYHCGGGPGPNVFDDLSALEAWVERGIAPEEMVAYKTAGQNDFAPNRGPTENRLPEDVMVLRSRPLCAYPKVARYVGRGSIDAAENFECVEQ